MVEFNTAILAGWMIYGYKALRVFNYKDYIIIEPLIVVEPDDFGANYSIIEIWDDQCFEMANGAGLLEIKFYLDSDYINETDYVLS